MGKGLIIKLYKLEPYPLLIEQYNVLYSNVFKYEMFEYYTHTPKILQSEHCIY